MAMKCFVCGKKLNLFSDYKQINIDGEKKEICAKCNRQREKKEILNLLQTNEGKQKVSSKGSILINTGIIEIIIGVILIFVLGSFFLVFAICIIVLGAISIFKGFSYKKQIKKII